MDPKTSYNLTNEAFGSPMPSWEELTPEAQADWIHTLHELEEKMAADRDWKGRTSIYD